jgi:hypothetical protein
MAGTKKKKPEQSPKKKYPPNRLRALMCLAGKYPQGSTPVSVPTPDPAENLWRLVSPPPRQGLRQHPLGTASLI